MGILICLMWGIEQNRLRKGTPMHGELEDAKDRMGLSGPQVIIVDPIGPVRMCIREILVNSGFLIVGEADDSKEAIKLASRMKPDLAIISARLKHGNGLDLLKMLRSIYPDIKVILLTTDASEVMKAAQNGETLLLAKPINQRRLLELAKSLTNQVASPAPRE